MFLIVGTNIAVIFLSVSISFFYRACEVAISLYISMYNLSIICVASLKN